MICDPQAYNTYSRRFATVTARTAWKGPIFPPNIAPEVTPPSPTWPNIGSMFRDRDLTWPNECFFKYNNRSWGVKRLLPFCGSGKRWESFRKEHDLERVLVLLEPRESVWKEDRDLNVANWCIFSQGSSRSRKIGRTFGSTGAEISRDKVN